MRAKDIMHAGAATFGEHETLTAAAKLMHDTGLGMLPIVGEDHQLLYKMRRLPVVDQHHLLGIISEADIARHLPEDEIASSVKAICAP
ncbi:MAG: CBS domain-containing protein [Candidatus Sericytochromatia bacterium]